MDIVIFGLDRLSALAAYVLVHDSEHRPVAFTVHERYISANEFEGLPVIRFEDLERSFPPERCAMLAPLGWRWMGELRSEIVRNGRSRGYRFISYVSSRALIWPDLVVGDNCMIFDGVIVQPFARIGENCIVRSGAMLSHDVELGDHSFVAARAVVGGRAKIGDHCVLGMNSTICSGVRIAPRSFIAAGALVTVDTDIEGIYRGAPARRSRVPLEKLSSVGS